MKTFLQKNILLSITVLAGCNLKSENNINELKPNILFIMADDLGAESLSCYGSTNFKTPNLDHLAQTGVRFENCYSSPICVVSRMQLMTGRYPFRTGWTGNTLGDQLHLIDPTIDTTGFVQWRFDATKETSFAQLLKLAGYNTCIVDKWMLSFDFKDHPNIFKEAGFDEHYMWRLWDTSIPLEYRDAPYNPITSGLWDADIWKDGPVSDGQGNYAPDLFCDYLINFIKKNQDRPFLAYWPMHLPHEETFHGRTTPPTPDSFSKNPDKTGRTIDKQEGMEDMIHYMDKLVGRLVAALDSLGIRENTLILFTGDNGTTSNIMTQLDDQIVPGGKGGLSESGCRVPLIANWKGTAPEGKVLEDLVDFTDFLPTLVEASGTKLPQNLIIDGQSFLPQLLGEKGNPRQFVYAQLNDRWFIRNLRWKLNSDGTLYNMSDRYNPVRAENSDETQNIKNFLSEEVKKLHH